MKKKGFALSTILLSFALSLVVLEFGVGLLRSIYGWKSKAPQIYEIPLLFNNSLLPKRESEYSLPTSMEAYISLERLENRNQKIDIDKSNAYAADYFIFDRTGLHSPRPDHQSRAIVKTAKDGKIVYDVTYTIDKHGRRVTPHANEQERDFFVALLGDSYVFGEGVEDSETLPSYMAKQTEKSQFYNMGFHGYGPNSLLARSLWSREFFQGIMQADGIGIYLFDSGDIPRTIGPMSLISRWGGDLSEFEFDGNIPIYLGSFKQNYQEQINFYKWFSDLDTVEVLGVDWPIFYLPSHFEKVGNTIEALKNEFINATDAQDFIVVVLREKQKSNWVHHKIMDQLDKRKIKYLDYTSFDVSKISRLPLYIDYEGHPRPLFYEILSKILVNDLGIK